MAVVLLPHPKQLEVERPWHTHLEGCSDCREAAGNERACPKAQAMHEDAVQAAHEAHAVALKAGHTMRLALPTAPDTARVWRRLLSNPAVARATPGPIPGVDISKYQGAADLSQVASSGQMYVIPKATEGNGYVDPYFARNWSEIHRLHLIPGAYHFSRPDLGNSPQAEADFFLSVTGTPNGWLPCHDAESAGGSEAWCRGWMDQFAARTRTVPGFYSFLSWIQSRSIGTGSALGQSWLWLAWPDSNGPLPIPAPWNRVAIQQYGAVSVPGIGGQTDVNRFFGSLADLAVLAGQAAPKRGIRHMRVIQTGGIDYITNGVQARGIGHPVELADLLRICGQDAPDSVSQYTKDRIEEVYPIPANEGRPVLDPWALASDAHTGASYGGHLGQIQASVDELGKAIHNGPAANPVDIEALAKAIVAKLPTANDPREVAKVVASVLGERLVVAPSPAPTPAPVTPTPTPVPAPTPTPPTGGS